MIETSLMLALKPELVTSDYETAAPHAGANMDELLKVAQAKDWPGYFGDPSRATASLGMRVYEQWLVLGKEFVSQILTGKDYRRLPRYGDLFPNDPADTNAMKPNSALEEQHVSWLKRRFSMDTPH